MSLDDRIGQLVRDAVEPMLSAALNDLEERLAARVASLVQRPGPDPPPLMTAKEVARLLGVSPRTVERMVVAGELPPAVPISPGRARWRRADIDAWIEGRGAS